MEREAKRAGNPASHQRCEYGWNVENSVLTPLMGSRFQLSEQAVMQFKSEHTGKLKIPLDVLRLTAIIGEQERRTPSLDGQGHLEQLLP